MTFYFSYSGNKRNEMQYIKKYVNLNNYDTIVEPFGGSCAFSRFFYDIDKTKKYIISDIDKNIIYFCNNFHKDSDKIINDSLNYMNEINNCNDFKKYIKNIDYSDLSKFLIYRTWFNLRPGLYSEQKPKYLSLMKNKIKLNDFFINNEYLERDYKEQLNLFKHDEKTLIFLDPPYILSCNALYDNPSIDWEFLYDWVRSCSCKFILVVNDNIFMRLLFKEYLKESNDKIYEGSKKKVSHNIYTNI